MRISCGKISAAVLVAVWAGSASVAAGGDFAVVKNGKAVAAFEFGAMPDAKSKAAADKDVALFNKYLKMVTGAELAEAAQDSSCSSVIRIDLKPVDDLATRFDWKIDFPSANVMRVEATTTSLFTALRQLIEEGCDARFLGTERCMFQFEPRKDVSVEARPRRNAPHNFSLLRDIYGTKGNRRELGLTDDGLFKYTHGIPLYAFPSDMYNRDGWPEAILPVKKGKKIERPPANPYCGWQPCYSNPETARIAVENIRAWLRKHPGAKSTTLGVNDLGGYCECETCKAMDLGAEKSIFANDRENHSASFYTFVNRVAAALADEFPDLRIGLLAYVDTIMPPKFEVARNVVPIMTFDTHSAGVDRAVREKHESVIRRWGEKVSETGTWDYSWGGGYYIPRVDFANRAARLKFLYANGGRAYFGENSMPDALDGPKTYLTARLLEDVDADADAILDEWYSRFAGRAAEGPLREIYRLSTEYWRSDEMKKSALWPARTWIYNYPYEIQFFALTPGFTERLLALAREVRGRAATPGERARAEVLLRHFERLDCIASFKGFAYMAPGSGELASAAAAAKMLENFAARADGLFEAWARVRRYFLESPDFDNPEVYVKSRGSYEATALLAEQFGKAAGFAQDPAVAAALEKVAALKCLPDGIRTLLANVVSGGGENCFSNPGFAAALDETRIKTTLPYEIVDGEGGRKMLRIWPGRPKGEPNPGDQVLWNVAAFSMTENLGAGFYMVSAKVRSAAKAARGDMVAWAQLDGVDKSWETLRPAALKKGESHTFVQVKCVKDTEDGLNVKLRVSGFGANDALDVEDVRIVKLMDVVKSGRAKSVSARGIVARDGSRREEVRGELAVVSSAKAYPFAHVVVDVPRILPEEKLVFTVRATLPDGAKTGQFGAILYNQDKGGWAPGPQLIWSRKPSAKGWEDISFSTTGAKLGKKRGKYLLILFKMQGTDAVAVSRISWKVTP